MPQVRVPKPVKISRPCFPFSDPARRFRASIGTPYTITNNSTSQRLHHTSPSGPPRPCFINRRADLRPSSIPTQLSQKYFLSTTQNRHASPPSDEPTPLSTDDYHRLADIYIDTLVAQLEAMQEEREDVDVEYSAGVLTLTLPPHGTYVLNKQPPNKQIWLSSPVSGPKRYDWVASKTGGGEAPEAGLEEGKEGEWVYLRDGSTLSELLEREMGVGMDV